jgi:recombination protein RecA
MVKKVSLKATKGAPEEGELSTAEKIKRVLEAVKNSGAIIGVANDPKMKKWIDYEKVKTPFPAINQVIDGGFPKGKFSIIAGPEQSCKSTICLYTIAERQRELPEAVWGWVDAENSFDEKWALNAGVDLGRLIVFKPMIMEELMQSVIEMIDTGALDGIVVDSVGALTPMAEVKQKKTDKEMTRTLKDDSVAALAKKIGQFFRMANEPVFRTQTCCLLIGHVYTPIGNDYVEFEVKGGNALKHWGHLRLLCRRRRGDQTNKIDMMMPSGKTKEIYPAYEAVFSVDKTRQGAHQGYEVSIPFVFGKGLSNVKSIIDIAFAYDVIQVGGAWCNHHALPNGKMQGKENTIQFIENNPDVFAVILEEVGKKLTSEPTNTEKAPSEELQEKE